jgi:hypothetical protein
MGKAVTLPLVNFIKAACGPSNSDRTAFLRVQFGTNGSYFAWTRSSWLCYHLPGTLRKFLKDVSSDYQTTTGQFNLGTPTHVAWLNDGSFFIVGYERLANGRSTPQRYHVWEFCSDGVANAWKMLWGLSDSDDQPSRRELAKLRHVALDTHSVTCDGFIFIKARKAKEEVEFVLRLLPGEPTSRLSPSGNASQSTVLQHKKPRPYTLARSLCRGRPHGSDTWEVLLSKDERVKVYEDKGNSWYLVENQRGDTGYAHESWLSFNFHLFENPSDAYATFQEDAEEILKAGNIVEFLDLRRYVKPCRRSYGCQEIQQNPSGLQICVHELEELLRGSGCYSRAKLKEERNKWHPDRFARFCHPDKREELKAQAQSLFVMMGILMDLLEAAQ